MPSFGYINDLSDIAHLPDNTLISWLTIMDDPSSEACAFVRRHPVDPRSQPPNTPTPGYTVWVSPGNGWEPESLDVIVLPVRVVLLGEAITAGDYLPEMFESDIIEPQWSTLDSGGTYPRDVALQAAVTLYQGSPPIGPDGCAAHVLAIADDFADWLTAADDPTATADGVADEISVDQMRAQPRPSWYAQMDPVSLPEAEQTYNNSTLGDR